MGQFGMDATTIAWVGFAATVISGIASGYFSRTDAFDRLFARSSGNILAGTIWESSWEEIAPDGSKIKKKEIFRFDKQLKNRIVGSIDMSEFPQRKWIIEGDYNDRFLRLFWTPSKDSSDRFFLDYGVYFFERSGEGSFRGYATGFDAEEDRVVVVDHTLTFIRSA